MKTIKFIAIVALSAAIAFVFATVVLAVTDNGKAFAVTYFSTAAILVVVAESMATRKSNSRYDSIRHKMGSKNYGQAAIFLGTACVFVGTPKECEERADDLWHYGQQVRVEDNIEGMEFNIL